MILAQCGSCGVITTKFWRMGSAVFCSACYRDARAGEEHIIPEGCVQRFFFADFLYRTGKISG